MISLQKKKKMATRDFGSNFSFKAKENNKEAQSK